MRTLEELTKMKQELETDLPIEDFIDWEFLVELIDSHIEALKKEGDK